VSMISQGAGPTDGHAPLLSSYRTELSGIITALYIIYRICDYYHLDSGKATLFCDNKGVIRKTFQPQQLGITPFLSSDYDLYTNN
jgi:hypothetical protein